MSIRSEKICSVVGCGGSHLAKGLCGKHYAAQWYATHPDRARELARNAYYKKNPQAKSASDLAMERPTHCVQCGEGQVVAKALCRNCYHKKFQREKDMHRKAVARARDPMRARMEARAYRRSKPEKAKLAHNKWIKANPEWRSVKDAKRRARKAGATGSFTVEQIRHLYVLQRGCCAVCKADLNGKYHKDHVEPLALGGSNDIKNIQLLCQPCNQSKHHRHPIEFMQSRGFLL